MVGFVVVGYALTGIWLTARLFWAIDAWAEHCYGPIPWYQKYTLLRWKPWCETLKLVLDLTLSFVGAGGARLIIPGVAAGPVGVLAGLVISGIIAGAPLFWNWRKRSYLKR